MYKKKNQLLKILILLTMSFLVSHCKFVFINQPRQAAPNETIEIQLQIQSTLVPEPNAHKGIICILTPIDWQFVSGSYIFSLGQGSIEETTEWADSASRCFPPDDFGENMKWIGLISDSGYAYDDPITIDVTIQLKVGTMEGCFDIAYLTTKATPNLICSGNPTWSAISYPHKIGIPDSTVCAPDLTALPAPEWTDLFTRTSGWTGADGIYSIPISGLEIPQTGSTNLDEVFVFSDTFIGEVDSNNHRQNASLINNTLGFLKGHRPVEENITFFWEIDNFNEPETVFIPNTPDSKPGDWYWLMDGIYLNDKVYVYALRLEPGDGGFFNFKLIGVNLIKFDAHPEGTISNVVQMDAPLLYLNASETVNIAFGQGLMPMTVESGNPGADGYIYIYGPKNSAAGKQLTVGRFLPENIENFSSYEFWNGTAWTNNIADVAVIDNNTSQELSVTPLADDVFLHVFLSGSNVYVSVGESPVGPFDFPEPIYNCPEPEQIPSTFVYNAKAHPNLSEPDELLISYNVNTFDFGDLFNNADTYRPRFITFNTNQIITKVDDHEPAAKLSFKINSNYPNPFNAFTRITFSLPENTEVTVKVIDMLGQVVDVITEKQRFGRGEHNVVWNASNYGSGVYLCQISSEKYNAVHKMVMIK
jgi:hypothetical protein